MCIYVCVGWEGEAGGIEFETNLCITLCGFVIVMGSSHTRMYGVFARYLYFTSI